MRDAASRPSFSTAQTRIQRFRGETGCEKVLFVVDRRGAGSAMLLVKRWLRLAVRAIVAAIPVLCRHHRRFIHWIHVQGCAFRNGHGRWTEGAGVLVGGRGL